MGEPRNHEERFIFYAYTSNANNITLKLLAEVVCRQET